MPLSAEAHPQWFEQALGCSGEAGQVEVEGVPVHYLARGDIGAPGLLLVHGYSAHAHWWDATAPAFADRYRVVALDLSGMGDSGHRAAYSIDTHAREIAAVCAAAGFEGPATLVAHSMGGSISLHAAAIHPGLCAHLVLVDAPVVQPPGRERSGQGSSFLRLSDDFADLDEARERFRLLPPQPCANQWLVDYIAGHSFRQTPEGRWIWKADGELLRHYQWMDLTEELMGLDCARDIIYGQQSQVVTPESLEYTTYVGDFPHPPVMVPGAMHHLFLDQPRAFIEALEQVLAQSPRVPG